MGVKNSESDREDLRGRPTKGMTRMSAERKIRLEPDMDKMLVEKCRRLGCTVADGIREGIKLFIRDKRY